METHRFQDAAEKMGSLGALPTHIPVAGGLVLRKVLLADAPALFDIIERNPEIKETVAWAAKVESVNDVIPRIRHRSNRTMDGRFVLVSEGKVVGYAGAHPGNQDQEFGLSYLLDKTSRGEGYINRSLTALIEELRIHAGAQHIYSQIIIGNEASASVARRLGFQPAETLIGVDFPVKQQRWRLELEKE
jgi:RimJ/RimL family protein N-acetyltransferase